MRGRILSYIGGLATIEQLPNSHSENDDVSPTLYKTVLPGIFRHQGKHPRKPKPGDYLEMHEENGKVVVDRVLERTTNLIRPNVANVDVVLIIQSVLNPDPSFDDLNRILLFYEVQDIPVAIVFTKSDLLTNSGGADIVNTYERFRQIYNHDGYITIDSNQEFLVLQQFLAGKTVCLAGHSGVGKSTLLNRLDPNYQREVQEISPRTRTGRHTTTNVVIVPYKSVTGVWGYLVDTPGFVRLDLPTNPQVLAKGWHDFQYFATKCKFSDCLHEHPNGCAVIQAVQTGTISSERYASYQKFLQEIRGRNS